MILIKILPFVNPNSSNPELYPIPNDCCCCRFCICAPFRFQFDECECDRIKRTCKKLNGINNDNDQFERCSLDIDKIRAISYWCRSSLSRDAAHRTRLCIQSACATQIRLLSSWLCVWKKFSEFLSRYYSIFNFAFLSFPFVLFLSDSNVKDFSLQSAWLSQKYIDTTGEEKVFTF